MAVFKIFPEKDAFISSEYPTENTGLDEILQLDSYPNLADQGQSSRLLLKFSDVELASVKTLISSSTYQAKLKLYLATADSVPVSYTVEAAPLYLSSSLDWNQGTGKAGDVPLNDSGVSWKYISTVPTAVSWSTNLPAGVTASYESEIGGGTWYTGSYVGSQTHLVNSTHDLDINVTNAVTGIFNNQISNKGFIVKLENSLEFNTGTPLKLSYFGSNTNTIYPPVLELHWDDQDTDNTLTEVSTDLVTVSVKNNKGVYRADSKQRFRLAVKPKYPTRTFSTGSIYAVNYKLPDTSLWALKDENTEELIVDFSNVGTKISSDVKGSYFDIYMNGLQPERYYRIFIKTVLDGSDVIIKTEQPFKVVRNG